MKKLNFPTAVGSLLSIVLLTLTIMSCKTEPKNSEKAAEKTQMQAVMGVHDAVMPKMGAIGRLVKELGQEKDSLLAISPVDQNGIATLEQGIDSLKAGHKQMMDWMKDFGAQFTAEEILKGKALSAAKKEALAIEAVKVANMEAAINGSIENAENLLEKF